MIQPSISRALWLYQTHAEYARGHQAFAVTVAYVHNDRLINVGGFNHDGNVIVFRSIPLLQDEDQPPTNGPFCVWMPYQKSQASKTDALTDTIVPRIAALETLVRAMTTPAQDPPAGRMVGVERGTIEPPVAETGDGPAIDQTAEPAPGIIPVVAVGDQAADTSAA